MNKRFVITGLITTVINLLLHGVAYFFILKDFYQSHPAGSEEFMKQLGRPPGQLIMWAMAVTALTMGFLITLIIKWSGAKTFTSGPAVITISGACAPWMLGLNKNKNQPKPI